MSEVTLKAGTQPGCVEIGMKVRAPDGFQGTVSMIDRGKCGFWMPNGRSLFWYPSHEVRNWTLTEDLEVER